MQCNAELGKKLNMFWAIQKFLAAPARVVSKKVMTDSKSYELGAVLLQCEDGKKWRSVPFTSRLLKSAE